MEKILNSLDLGIVIFNEKEEIVYANDTCLKWGIISSDVKGKKYYEAFKSLELIDMTGKILKGEKRGGKFEYSGRVYRINPIEEVPAIKIEDITEFVKFERLQREFSASVSHELSTPISAIKGLLETALMEENPDRKLIERALKRTQDMERMINALKLLVLIETGGKSRKERVSLKNIIGDVIQDLAERIKEMKVKVKIEGEDLQVITDREKVYILLKNIIENAVKYNRKEGAVFIRILKEGKNPVVEVEDTGEGISKEEIPLLFQPFFGGKNKKGMGLGLTISKKIADNLGIQIEIRSGEGKGTTVKAVFPEEI